MTEADGSHCMRPQLCYRINPVQLLVTLLKKNILCLVKGSMERVRFVQLAPQTSAHDMPLLLQLAQPASVAQLEASPLQPWLSLAVSH